MTTFSIENFHSHCDHLANTDKDLAGIIEAYSYPPFWTRPNSFETLVLTILEQQVSLASAYAAYKKLKERLSQITPENLLSLTDADMRSCYISRQKTIYTRGLAEAVLSGEVDLHSYQELQNDEIRTSLKKLKGIGDWTVDIYLVHALQRADIFPTGDLALLNAIKMVKKKEKITKEEALTIARPWEPYRSIATMMLWHYYIKVKKIKLEA